MSNPTKPAEVCRLVAARRIRKLVFVRRLKRQVNIVFVDHNAGLDGVIKLVLDSLIRSQTQVVVSFFCEGSCSVVGLIGRTANESCAT